jgi:hypothetical protein
VKQLLELKRRRRGDSLDDYTRSKIRDLSISKPHLFEKINLNDYIKGGRLEDSDRERLTDWGDLGWITTTAISRANGFKIAMQYSLR